MDAGPPLSATGGGGDLSPIIAGVAILAVAEVASSADFAGSLANFAGMAFPAVAGMGIPVVVGAVPLTNVAGMALPAVAKGVPSAVCFSELLLAVAEVDPLFVAEMASSADLRGPAGPPDILNPLSDGDSWDQEDTVTVPEFFRKSTDPTSVVWPDMNGGMPDTKNSHPDCSLDNTEIQHGASREGQQLPRNDSEVIAVGAVGSAAPWFLTGWAEGTEVEFIINKECQFTILATSVFDSMCVSDPRMCSRLRPCRRRLVLADSSPLLVRGELEMTVVFPGLSCAMVLVQGRIQDFFPVGVRWDTVSQRRRRRLRGRYGVGKFSI